MKTNPNSIASIIRQRIEAMPLGEPFMPRKFLGCGSRGAVDQTLLRLVRNGVIARVARGIYARSKFSRLLNEIVPPSPFKIAKAIVETTGDAIQTQGAEAANLLQLSTQVPVRPIFLTSGPSRRIQLGGLEICLKHVCSRKLVLAGRPAGLALSALWYLGKNEVTPKVIGKIQRNLPEEEFAALESATTAMPAWMREAFSKFKENRHA
jgi:hypothetical protein